MFFCTTRYADKMDSKCRTSVALACICAAPKALIEQAMPIAEERGYYHAE